MLPEFFAASSRGDDATPPAPIEHVIDTFTLVSAVLTARVVVGADARGALQVIVGDLPDGALQPRAQKQLLFHEIRLGRRTIQADRLFVLEIELLEHATSPDEINDPVYLYGALSGPLAYGLVANGTKGQLTITRGDLFAGFLDEKPRAFAYAAPGSLRRLAYHALLPGANVSASGRDVVLAYPLASMELADDDLDNAAIVQAILEDTLRALYHDVVRQDAQRSRLARWLSRGDAGRVEPKPGATLEQTFALAGEALALLPDWPSARSQGLRRCTRDGVAGEAPPATTRPATARHGARVPGAAPTPTPTPAAVPQAPPSRPSPSGPPDWMRDFAAQRQNAARTVSWSRWAPQARTSSSDWMRDFDPAKEKGAPAARPSSPSWMSDFDPPEEGS